MDLRFTPEQEAFRAEVRAFLDEHLPEERGQQDGEMLAGGWSPRFSRKLAVRGWVGLVWPTEDGGSGLGHMEQMIFNEEMAYQRAPAGAHRRGVFYAGPILINHGTDEQKSRFLSMIASGEGYFCQGFSEPNSGSDLASLQSTAIEDGDEFVLNGTKI